MPKRIQLSRAKGWRLPPGAVKVDRATQWGNPYRIGEPVDMKQVRRWGWSFSPNGQHHVCTCAAEAVARFRHALLWDGAIHDHVRSELAGRDLACWCEPGTPCHADVLIEIANADPADIAAVHEEEDRKIMDEKQIRHIAKMTCEVNEHYGKCPCMECIASAREFFVRMTLKK